MNRSGRLLTVAFAAVCLSISGCGNSEEQPKANDGSSNGAMLAPPVADPALARDAIQKLHAALKAKNPDYADDGQADVTEDGQIVVLSLREAKVTDLSPLQGLKLRILDLFNAPVSDLSPLKGMPLTALYLEGTRVSDLSPLKDSPITELYLSRAPVEDLNSLKGMPISSLNLLGTQVRDLSPLVTLPLQSLWLNSTPVSDITPLAGCRKLQSLTLYGTYVTDLAPLADLPQLKRLHIGNTNVTDLRPLSRLNLERLIFDPSKIEHGIDVIRAMPSLYEIGPTLEGKMEPRAFWQRYDAGDFKK